MDPRLLSFQRGGLTFANKKQGRDVTLKPKDAPEIILNGSRTELTVDPGDGVPGGFRFKRAFSIMVEKQEYALRMNVPIKALMLAVDDMGRECQVVRWDVDHLGTTIYFGSRHE